jgi:hypothetical protein
VNGVALFRLLRRLMWHKLYRKISHKSERMSSAIPPTNPMGTPFERGSPVEPYPINGSSTKPFFPSVKISSHWDPTRIYARSVPTSMVPLPVDFRPYTKICQEYRTTAPEQAAPQISDDVVFPMGGEVYPPTRYQNNIDNESRLRRMDRPLGTCDNDQYLPPLDGDMYRDRMLVPESKTPVSRFVSELSMPQALLRVGAYKCREEADQFNWDRSPRLFNNATKQDRYRAPNEPPRPNLWTSDARCKATELR